MHSRLFEGQLIQYLTCRTGEEQWASDIKYMCVGLGMHVEEEFGRKKHIPE